MKKFPWLVYLLVLCMIGAITFAPIGGLMVTAAIAHSHGCQVDEGSVHPCIVGGKDYGHLLYTLGVFGWLMLITLPFGAVAFLAWLVVLLLHRNSWKKKQRAVLV